MVQTQVPATQNCTSEVQDFNRLQTVIPPVDIFEEQDSVTLIADVPGIDKEQLEINVENRVLSLFASTTENNPAEPVYREYRPVHYYRQFNLSDRVNAEDVSAELKNGVLTLRIPKAEEAKPKKIEVKTE